MAESLDTTDLKDMEEEVLWNLINDNRHAVSLAVRPCLLIPYLRQARVLTELDEDEILSCLKLTNRVMRTGHMLDLLQAQGRNGAVALLESLMIHYPPLYTKITGRKPTAEPSAFSGLIKYTELTEYLVQAVSTMQRELHEARHEAAQQQGRCSDLEIKLSQALQNNEDLSQMQGEQTRLRSQLSGLHRDLLKLKDEKCDLYVRYTAAVEEKSALSIRNQDLLLQVYQMQCELRKAQKETDFQRQRSSRNTSPSETHQLREENTALRAKLLEAETFTPAKNDILAQDLKEARDRRSELVEDVNRLSEENQRLQQEKEELLEEKDCLILELEKLTVDCEMYHHKSSLFQKQLGEVQAERDRAYLSRDEAQAQTACSLAEKDNLRDQLMELQEKTFALKAWDRQREGKEKQSVSSFCWESTDSSSESPVSRPRAPLRRTLALHPEYSCLSDASQLSGDAYSSVRSNQVEPPCSESLRRRELDLHSSREELYGSQDLTDDSASHLDDFVFIPDEGDENEPRRTSPIGSASTSSQSDSVSRAPAPLFLVRSRQQTLSDTTRVNTVCFQGEMLLKQLQVIGGNKTGVFVHHVNEESYAHSAGISPGSQILQVKYESEQRAVRMVLEDITMEEAEWALGQVQGQCQMTLKPSQDVYDHLVQQLEKGEVMSGDSFYIRVNLTLSGDVAGSLTVRCNDIVHVTNTRPSDDSSWWGSHVHPCQLLDLKSGSLPNYYRGQRLLIQAIEAMTHTRQTRRKVARSGAGEKQRAVRIVSTGQRSRNPMWVSVEDDKNAARDNDCVSSRCVTLMPYTLVTPHYPPICRPVLLLPTILGRVLHKRLAEQEGYHLCEPEMLMGSSYAAYLQKGWILEKHDTHLYYTHQAVEKIIRQGIHCVLPLGLDCVRRLHRAEIFPIVMFIMSSERSIRKLKHRLRQNVVTESQVLECVSNEEPLLDKLPCLYRSVPPDSWSDTSSLVDTLKAIVSEEQKKVVWVESDIW